ncbi:MAG: hypothetical protein M1839_008151 [Geoglossum umbratile]|nr:MAG: hypothetical protein M1839_008151 [Geoglossum umbratile]
MSDTPFGTSDPSHYFVPLRRPITRSPSPSRSPARAVRFSTHVLDPLLSDLSPSKTLEALSSSPTFASNGGRSSALQASIAVASPAQRAFAVRAALAHKKLREWSVELSSWVWPSSAGLSDTSRGFQVLSWEERAAKRKRTDGGRYESKESWEVVMHNGGGGLVTAGKASFGALAVSSPELCATGNGDDSAAELDPDDEYWGSLPARRVLEYEERIEVIKGEMEALDLEELKSQVLDAHLPSRSRPSSSYDEVDDEPVLGNYVPLGDFTALVTATTLQALPYLSRVMSLLNTWSIRVAVLRIIPRFLVNLEEMESLVKVAFEIIAASKVAPDRSSPHGNISEVRPGLGALGLADARHGRDRLLLVPPGENFTRGTFNAVRKTLEEKVTSLGQLLDNMLDDLEGRDDTIPEEWIEKMETIEESYGDWVVDAEKKVLESEWRQSLRGKAQLVDNTRNGQQMDSADAGGITIESDGLNEDGVVEDGESGREVAAVRTPDLAPGELLEDTPTSWSLGPTQQVDDGGGRERANEAAWGGDTEMTGVDRGEANDQVEDGIYGLVPEDPSWNIPNIRDPDAPTAQQAADARNCELDQTDEALEGDMVGEMNVVEVIPEIAEFSLGSSTQQVGGAGAIEKVDEMSVQHPRGTASEESVIEGVTSETEMAGGEPGESEADDQETYLGGAYNLVEDVPRRASITCHSVYSLPTPEPPTADQESIERNSVDIVLSDAPAQANGIPLTPSRGEGYGLSFPSEMRPETPPLQRRLRPGSPTILPPISMVKADSPIPLCDISNPSVPANANFVETLPMEISKDTENSALGPERASPDSTLGDPGLNPAPESPTQVGGDPPIATATGVVREMELIGQDPSAFQVGSDSDSDDPQDTPDLSVRSSPSGSVSRVRSLELPGLMTSVGTSQPRADEISESPLVESLSPIILSESQATATARVTIERQRDLHLGRVALGIRGLAPEAVSLVSADERTHIAETAQGCDPHDDSGLKTAPRDIAPIGATNQRTIANLNELPREQLDTDAEFRRIGPSTGVHIAQQVAHDCLDSSDSPALEASVTDSHLSGIGSEFSSPVMLDTPDLLGSPEPAASKNFRAATESCGQSSTVELLPSTDGVIAGVRPLTGGSMSTKPVESCNLPLRKAIPVTESLNPDYEALVEDGLVSETTMPTSDECPEALLQEGSPDIARPRNLFSSPLRMGHTPENAVPQTPISMPCTAASQKLQPSALLPSFSIDDTEEQSPSVRQYMKRHDTASSGEDPLESLPALRIPKRRQKTHSSPEKSPVMPESTRQKTSDPTGPENEKIYGRGPVELTKALESAAESTDDHLEKKISSILTTIPARIRLSSEVEIEPSPSGGQNPPKSYATVSPGVRPLRATSASPSFTLAPAYAKNPRPRAKGGNPDIKLYHLHRSSGEAPIKLFVRLVGENGERVMVRVGGGWADLGEYLKEYATHHGRRSASDGRIEIQDIPKLNSKSSIASLRAQATGRSTPTGRPDSAMSRPGSSLAFARSRAPEGSPIESRTPTTPQFASARRQELTPPSGSSSVSSMRSSSRLSWTGTEEEPALGLAGPKSKKVDISPDKQAWVEGMLGQVRKASAQKREEADFGSLGKIGTTKRVFRRGSKGSAGDLI